MVRMTNLLLKFFDYDIETFYFFFFAFKLPFFLFEDIYLNFFSLDFVFKIRNLIILILSYSFDDFFFLCLKNLFNLWEVGFNNLSHSSEVFKQSRNLLHCCTKNTSYFRLHFSDHCFNFFFVSRILSYQGTLEFHNCLNDKLELIDFRFLFFLYDFVVFKDLCYYRVELWERIG